MASSYFIISYWFIFSASSIFLPYQCLLSLLSQNAAAKNPFVLCILQPVAGKQVASFHLLGNEGKVTELTEQPEEDLDKRIVTFRIKAQITLHLYVDSGKSPNSKKTKKFFLYLSILKMLSI